MIGSDSTAKVANGGDKIKLDHERNSQKQEERGHWGSKMEFMLACLGYSVGLVNLWRFPYLAYENGGASFLIPYLILLVVIGRPMYLMEVSLGQYSQLGPLHTFKRMAPLFAGLGYAYMVRFSVDNGRYMIIMGYSAHYLYNSLAYIGHELPWATCDPSWSDERCYVVGEEVPCSQYNLTAPTADINCTLGDQSSATQYWKNGVLSLDPEGIVSFGDLGSVNVGLVLSLLVSWVITCLSLLYGIKSSGKVVYFTATFPFVVLLVLTITGVQLPGAYLGLEFLLVPKWEKMLDVTVWRLALEQCLYSLSIGGGGMITFGSYNSFNTKAHRYVLILSVLDLLASMLCAVTVFSVLGAMAHELGYDDIKDVVASGPGLAFIAYPEAITRTLPMPHLFSALFFLMVLTLGLDSIFGGMETLLTTVFDEFPKTRRYKPFIVAGICTLLFGAGIPYCTEKGQYLFHLFDVITSAGGLLYTFMALIALHWVYGVQEFSRNLRFMMGYSPSILMKMAWAVLAPVTLFVLFISSVYRWKWPLYAGIVSYPDWAYAMAFSVPIIAATPVVTFMMIHLFNKISTGKWREIRQPAPEWGPGCPEARQRLADLNRMHKEDKMKSQESSEKKGVEKDFFEMQKLLK